MRAPKQSAESVPVCTTGCRRVRLCNMLRKVQHMAQHARSRICRESHLLCTLSAFGGNYVYIVWMHYTCVMQYVFIMVKHREAVKHRRRLLQHRHCRRITSAAPAGAAAAALLLDHPPRMCIQPQKNVPTTSEWLVTRGRYAKSATTA